MGTGGMEDSQREAGQDQPPATDELQEALGRLRSRLEEVSAWAQQASLPGAESIADQLSHVIEPAQPGPSGTTQSSGTAQPSGTTHPSGTAQSSETTLEHVRNLSHSGAIAQGVFREGREVVDLRAPHVAGHVSASGLAALLDLIPTDTVLEVRTTGAEVRAARIGDEAFALELVAGSEPEVDEWLASLLPAGET